MELRNFTQAWWGGLLLRGWVCAAPAVVAEATPPVSLSSAPPAVTQSGVPSGPDAAALAKTLASLTAEEWAALPPELRAELEALKPPAWQVGATVNLAAGWRDNPLLSAVAAEGRAFLRSQLETFLWQLPKGAWEGVAFLNGDVTRYLRPMPELAGEQAWFGHGELRWQPRPAVRATLSLQGYFQDQVFDLSATETERVVARLRVHGSVIGGEVRVAPASPVAFAALVQSHESRYRGYSEDFGEAKVGGRLIWTPAPPVSLTVSLLSREREYDARPAYTLGGRPLAGTQLSLHQDEMEVKLQFSRGRWTSATTVLGLENRDGGSGYFDYDERRGRWSLEWKKEPWRVALEASGVRYRYRVQTVGVGFDPPKRRRDDVEVTLRTERGLGPRWTLFAEAQAERSRSNEENASYTQTTIMAGLAFTPSP